MRKHSLKIPVTLHSFEIKYQDGFYIATIFFITNDDNVSSIRNPIELGSFKGAKEWIEETTGMEIK